MTIFVVSSMMAVCLTLLVLFYITDKGMPIPALLAVGASLVGIIVLPVAATFFLHVRVGYIVAFLCYLCIIAFLRVRMGTHSFNLLHVLVYFFAGLALTSWIIIFRWKVDWFLVIFLSLMAILFLVATILPDGIVDKIPERCAIIMLEGIVVVVVLLIMATFLKSFAQYIQKGSTTNSAAAVQQEEVG